MNLETRKKYYNLCDPYKVFPITSKQNIDFDTFMIDGRTIDVRGKVWAEEIAKDIAWSDEPTITYFTGYRGTGKTTELHRVASLLSDKDEHANLLPVYINAIDYFDLHDTIDLPDILTAIIYSVIKEVGKYKGLNEEEAFGQNDFFSRTWHWLTTTDVTLSNLELGSNDSRLIFNMKETPSFRKKIRNAFSDHFSKYKEDIYKELEKLNDEVKSYDIAGERKDGILVILDQLEQNRGVSTKVDQVKSAIEEVFANRVSLKLPIDVIYTIPTFLSTKKVIENVNFLPVIKVITKDGHPNADGIEAMKSFIYKRVPKNDWIEILGDEYNQKIESVIAFSGGYPRDLLLLLQDMIQSKNYPITDANIDTMFQERMNNFSEFMTKKYEVALREIYETKQKVEDESILFELFNAHAIFRYRNKNLWYALHPAVRKILDLA